MEIPGLKRKFPAPLLLQTVLEKTRMAEVDRNNSPTKPEWHDVQEELANLEYQASQRSLNPEEARHLAELRQNAPSALYAAKTDLENTTENG